MQGFFDFPLPFWFAVVAIIAFAYHAWQMRFTGWGIPTLAVLGTVTAWYIGDALYNDYSSFPAKFGEANLEAAWWEVTLFVVAFGCLVPPVHRALNRDLWQRQRRGSQLLAMMRGGGIYRSSFQHQIDRIGKSLALLWAILMAIALVRTDFDFRGLFMPYLGGKADPWGRGRLGGGFDSLLAFAGYFQILVAAMVGVVAALAMKTQTRIVAIAIYLLIIPGYIFDRTRNTMLATILPALLAWTFFRLRGSILLRVLVLAASFLILNSWMKFVIQNRSDVSIVSAFGEGGERWNNARDAKHLGLNMFEELSWINSFIADGSYSPNWGQRYFSEIANPIPRALWPGKPMIGIDYAVARGQRLDEATSNDAGVGATISTGMIGQGVVNFGQVLGPLAAALIMAFWVAVLARQDLLGAEMGRLLLYVVGLVLTFNMGRDITLLVIYPFCFGYLLLYFQQDTRPRSRQTIASTIPSSL